MKGRHGGSVKHDVVQGGSWIFLFCKLTFFFFLSAGVTESTCFVGYAVNRGSQNVTSWRSSCLLDMSLAAPEATGGENYLVALLLIS